MGTKPMIRYVLQDLMRSLELLKSGCIVKLNSKTYFRIRAKLNHRPKAIALQNLCGVEPWASSSILYHFCNSNFLKIGVSYFGGYLLIKSFWKSPFSVEAAALSLKKVIEEADLLYDTLQFEEIYQLLLAYKDVKNADILWRLARATFEKAKGKDKASEKKVLYGEALNLLKEAERIDGNNFAVHKWLAIIMDCYYTLDGIKSRISHLYDMKIHMERACELKPNDGTSWYVLGMWYFGIANISWYEKKAASIFFATPPEATFEEALKFFMEAEKVEPNFYSKNLLMMGKCLYYLGRMDESKIYLLKAKDYLQKTEDDKEAAAEADKWLKGL